MANKVTGSTDTSGAISTSAKSNKCVILVGRVSGTASETVTANTIFTISGTADAKAKFGDTSKFTEAVKLLIMNGVSYIKGIIVSPTTEEGTDATKYEEALATTLTDKSIKCILMDNYTSDVVTKLKTHLTTAESNDLFRYSVVATSSSTQNDLVSFAASVDNKRIFIPGPPCKAYDSNTDADPVILATGLTALIMTETSDPALPMNGVPIKGLGGVSRAVLNSEMAVLSNSGITALYNNDDGQPTVYRLVTSDVDEGKIWQEGTTLFIADYVLDSVESRLRNKFKRTKNTARVLDSIKTEVKIELENAEALEIIENFDPSTLSVIKDPSDMYGALVDYEFDVVTPLYTITIVQHMKF